jgi:hypothetical protein
VLEVAADARSKVPDYLRRSISASDAQIASGYHAGLIAPAIANFNLDAKPNDVRALVAYITS